MQKPPNLSSLLKRGMLITLLTLGVGAQAAWAEAPAGDWVCTGSSPGDTRLYKGYVNVEKSGETYTVMWRFGTTTYLGTGIDLGDHFAVAFIKTGQQGGGLAIFRKHGSNWEGLWTPLGGKMLGKETWQPMGQGQAPPPTPPPAAGPPLLEKPLIPYDRFLHA